MSSKEHRVLSRIGAYELTREDLENVNGAKLTVATAICTGPVSNPDSGFDQ